MQIEGNVAFVTGANRGLGMAFVDALLAGGARKVYAAARDVSTLPERWADDARIVAMPLDITQLAQQRAAVALASDTRLLINNAGVNRLQSALIDDDLAAARAEMDVNYFGTLQLTRCFAPILRRGAANAEEADRPAIVNMLSILARVTLPMMTTLCASKAAALRMTEGVRAELAPHGVRVLAVMPGAIDTDMSRDFPPPKLAVGDVVEAVFSALQGDADEVYIGDMARHIATQLASDRIAIQRQLASMA
ncbi:SDR family NAD(P)-dependent oxidoreductase [Robbsia sp. KACC 23696]|uniref:SDR family NAD(P)-dependent oxidoreductase n=1 Tax=Robbsia sp. KACC 23696 TaxID=3149231 RepID=UPI00325BF12F